MELTHEVRDMLRGASPCFVTTLMPDGSPQMTETWVDVDGDRVLVNTFEGAVKVDNVRRDPRVALIVADPANVFRYVEIRGRVAEITTDGAAEHIEALSQRYLGRSYPGWGGDVVRVKLVIDAERVREVGG